MQFVSAGVDLMRDYRRWVGRRGVYSVCGYPNRTEVWFRIIFGVRFYEGEKEKKSQWMSS